MFPKITDFGDEPPGDLGDPPFQHYTIEF